MHNYNNYSNNNYPPINLHIDDDMPTDLRDKWQLYDDYMNHTNLSAMGESGELSPHTIAARKNDLTQLLNAFEDPINVTAKDIREWMLSKKGHGWNKARTYRRKLMSYKMFYNFLVNERVIKYSPAAPIKAPRMPRNYDRKAFTLEQARLVARKAESPSMSTQDRAIFFTLITSSLRANELCLIEKEHINLKDRIIFIPRENNKGKKLSKRVPFSNKAKSYIEKMLSEDITASKYLFHKYDGNRLTGQNIYTLIKSVISRAFPYKGDWNSEWGPHILRHSFATLWLENHGDRTALQQIMGYTSQNEIETYAKACTLSTEFINKEARKITRVFKNKYNL